MKYTGFNLRAVLGTDGRHHYVPIMADAPEFQSDKPPFHPLIASVHHGRGHAPQPVAEEISSELVRRWNAHKRLVKATAAFVRWVESCWGASEILHPDTLAEYEAAKVAITLATKTEEGG